MCLGWALKLLVISLQESLLLTEAAKTWQDTDKWGSWVLIQAAEAYVAMAASLLLVPRLVR